jgi:hypothetical protein
LLAALTVGLSGCGSGLSEGPLGARPENHSVISQPAPRGGAVTIGFDVVYNGGSAPAVIDRLVLATPHNIKLIGAYLTIGGPMGDWVTFPPILSASDRNDVYPIRYWANRHKPTGAVVPPHQWAGIALGLEVTGARGSIAATDLFYHVGNTHYEWQSRIRIMLALIDCRARQSGAGSRAFCRLVESARDHEMTAAKS